MKYKLIAVDMDGTLLDSSKSITPRTVNAVKRAGERSVCVCLSTGRPLCGVRQYLDQLALSTPVITCNGAVIANAATGEVLFRQCLEPEDARNVWQCGQSYAVTMVAWVGDRLYANDLNTHTEDYKKLSGVEPEIITDIGSIVGEGISKILWIDTPQNIARYRDELRQKLAGEVSFVTSAPYFLEFFHSRVSKARAMEFLGGYLGITQEEMIAIGDGENDLSMLEYAGLGVAMGNASEAVKARCDCVTASNDEDGVAQVIEDFCLAD